MGLLKRNSRQRGFTLIELLLVLAIFSISMALVSPRLMKGMRGAHLKATARKVASALKYARERSLRERRNYYAEALKEKFVIRGAGDEAARKEVPIPDDASVAQLSGPVAVFYPAGSSSGGEFEVSGAGGKAAYSVKVEPSTGGVSVNAL